MKNYNGYINTNIEWLRTLPSEWKVVPLKKYLSDIVDYRGKTPKKVEDGIFLVTAKNIRNGKINYGASKEYIKESDYLKVMSRGMPQIGDVLLTTEAPLGETANIDNTNIALAQRVIKLRGNEKLDNYFLKYFISSYGFQSHIYSFATGSTALGIKGSKISELKIVLPSLNEQKSIANFLDQKTSDIDALISDKEKLIKLLEEKRQAIITEAVTKGLDPGVKMKDSGVEWIGEIPEHWDMKKLRFLGRFQNGISKSAEYFDHGSPFVSYGDVYNNFELPIAVNGLVDSTQLEKEAYSVKSGDVFFTRTSETVDEIGLASTCMKSIEGATFAGFLIRFRPFTGKLVPQFSKFYFRNQLSRKYFVKEMNIVTRASLGQNLLKNYPVILPPVTEQKTIANYLESMNEQTDKLIQENKYTIEKFKEYRQALIYEAVTGKIDVQEMLKETEQEEVSSL